MKKIYISYREQDFLNSIGDGVLRIFLSLDEIKTANALVKRGALARGVMPNRQNYTYFYKPAEAENLLEVSE